jgi:hypothetical protein
LYAIRNKRGARDELNNPQSPHDRDTLIRPSGTFSRKREKGKEGAMGALLSITP